MGSNLYAAIVVIAGIVAYCIYLWFTRTTTPAPSPTPTPTPTPADRFTALNAAVLLIGPLLDPETGKAVRQQVAESIWTPVQVQGAAK